MITPDAEGQALAEIQSSDEEPGQGEILEKKYKIKMEKDVKTYDFRNDNDNINLFDILKVRLQKKPLYLGVSGDGVFFTDLSKVPDCGYDFASNGKHVFVIGRYVFYDYHNENSITHVGLLAGNDFSNKIGWQHAFRLKLILCKDDFGKNFEKYSKDFDTLDYFPKKVKRSPV